MRIRARNPPFGPMTINRYLKKADQKQVKLPTALRTRYTWCPRRCTQHRTASGRMGESKTFNGRRCENCGFTYKPEQKHTFSKYTYKKKER